MTTTKLTHDQRDHDNVAAWRDELSYFERMKAVLWRDKRYRNKYVAIRRHSVVDVGDDKFSLARRVFEKFPDEVVLIEKVRVTVPVARLRSPKLA